MKNILIIGATGQIGTELTVTLRKDARKVVVAGYIPTSPPSALLSETGPTEEADITQAAQIAAIVEKYRIDTIYNLAAILSASAEQVPLHAWHIGINGLLNVLEVARSYGCAVFTPSSISVFGATTPKQQTPQDTICQPQMIYGITKVSGELLSNYYYNKFGVDTRSVRFPGLISHLTPPGGGTTDYAVAIYHAAAQKKPFVCPIQADTLMDMMYMPDALRAAIMLMEANPERLIHRNAFNVTAMSLSPQLLTEEIRKHIPEFSITYAIDPLRQSIAASWPDSLDDSAAREEWDWQPRHNITTMTQDMLYHLSQGAIAPLVG